MVCRKEKGDLALILQHIKCIYYIILYYKHIHNYIKTYKVHITCRFIYNLQGELIILYINIYNNYIFI